MGIESTLDTPLAEAVRRTGSQSAFARLVGKNQSSVYDLLKDNRPLWPESVLIVEESTGVSRHDLRPDIYPRESAEEPSR